MTSAPPAIGTIPGLCQVFPSGAVSVRASVANQPPLSASGGGLSVLPQTELLRRAALLGQADRRVDGRVRRAVAVLDQVDRDPLQRRIPVLVDAERAEDPVLDLDLEQAGRHGRAGAVRRGDVLQQ